MTFEKDVQMEERIEELKEETLLSPAQAEHYVLIDFMTHSELADYKDLHLGTVKKRSHNIQQKIEKAKKTAELE